MLPCITFKKNSAVFLNFTCSFKYLAEIGLALTFFKGDTMLCFSIAMFSCNVGRIRFDSDLSLLSRSLDTDEFASELSLYDKRQMTYSLDLLYASFALPNWDVN